MTVSHFDALDLPVLDDDLYDVGVSENLAAGPLNFRNDAIGDLPATTDRIKASVQIVSRDHRVHHEHRPLGRQPHVAPLTAEYGDQVRVIRQLAEYIVGIAVQPGGFAPTQVRPQQPTLPWPEHSLHSQCRGCFTRLGE